MMIIIEFITKIIKKIKSIIKNNQIVIKKYKIEITNRHNRKLIIKLTPEILYIIHQ